MLLYMVLFFCFECGGMRLMMGSQCTSRLTLYLICLYGLTGVLQEEYNIHSEASPYCET